MANLTDRAGQLEREAANLNRSIAILQEQVQRLIDVERAERSKVGDIAADAAVLRQRLDEQAKRNEELQKRIESWEARVWAGGLAVVGALLSAVVALAIAFIRK